MLLSAAFLRCTSAAHAYAQEGPRHLAVEGPVAEGGPVGETPFQLDADQVHAHRLWRTRADGRRQVGGFAGDHGFHHRLGGGLGVTRNWPFMPASSWPGTLHRYVKSRA